MRNDESAGLPFVPYRRLDRLFRASERIWHDRPDVREHCGQVRSWESWDLDQYGSTFILRAYVRELWADVFQIVAIHEAPDGWQDYVILRR